MPLTDNASRLGGQLADVALYSTAAGAGGMGLWHLLKHFKNKREQAKAQQKDFQSIANAPPEFLSPKAAYDISNAALPAVGGAGLGALIGALRAGKGNRLSGALTGGVVGGGLGAAGHGLVSEEGRHALGELMGASPGNSSPQFKSILSRSNYNLALPVVGGLGAAAGAGVVNSLVRDTKDDDNKDKVRQSRDDYFKTLLNHDDEKTAFDAAVDELYARREKQAEPTFGERLLAGWNAFKDTGQAAASIPPWVMGVAALGAGGVGAKYMYDKTRAGSQAKLYAAAQKARERLKGLDSPWVDPVELAHIKHITAQGGLQNAAGG